MDYNKLSKYDIENLKRQLKRETETVRYEITRDIRDQNFYLFLATMFLFIMLLLLGGPLIDIKKSVSSIQAEQKNSKVEY